MFTGYLGCTKANIYTLICISIMSMVFNATFNNISVISWHADVINIYVNLTVTKRTRNKSKCIRSAETHFSFGLFTHEEYVSMDATS
jgi:hypothetical protein